MFVVDRRPSPTKPGFLNTLPPPADDLSISTPLPWSGEDVRLVSPTSIDESYSPTDAAEKSPTGVVEEFHGAPFNEGGKDLEAASFSPSQSKWRLNLPDTMLLQFEVYGKDEDEDATTSSSASDRAVADSPIAKLGGKCGTAKAESRGGGEETASSDFDPCFLVTPFGFDNVDPSKLVDITSRIVPVPRQRTEHAGKAKLIQHFNAHHHHDDDDDNNNCSVYYECDRTTSSTAMSSTDSNSFDGNDDSSSCTFEEYFDRVRIPAGSLATYREQVEQSIKRRQQKQKEDKAVLQQSKSASTIFPSCEDDLKTSRSSSSRTSAPEGSDDDVSWHGFEGNRIGIATGSGCIPAYQQRLAGLRSAHQHQPGHVRTVAVFAAAGAAGNNRARHIRTIGWNTDS